MPVALASLSNPNSPLGVLPLAVPHPLRILSIHAASVCQISHIPHMCYGYCTHVNQAGQFAGLNAKRLLYLRLLPYLRIWSGERLAGKELVHFLNTRKPLT
jgi:hypothetical protein